MDAQASVLKACGDGIAACTILATLAGILPPLAAVVAIAWHVQQFYDRYQAKRREREDREPPRG
jgi:hypothetical protein